MIVIEADALGMCFGVRDALAALAAVAAPQDATIRGELVHNPLVLQQLSLRGFRQQSEGDRTALPETPTVVVTAHGISRKERVRLEAAGKSLLDTTCPLVARVHEAARELQEEGRFVIVLGKPSHVEVRGVVGDLPDCAVVPSPVAVRSYAAAKLGVVCQSTLPPSEAEPLVAEIRRKNPGKDVRFIDTICRPTRERQEAMAALLPRVDAVVVVGGRHSNNTKQLVRLAEAAGLPALHVEGAHELQENWCRQFARLGLAAGTSTLDETIAEVRAALRRLAKEPTDAAA